MTLEELMTGVRGYGQGVTAGLIQYPQAGLKALVNKQGFKESLADLREENARLAVENPKAWMGGNIGGGALAAIGTGGAGLAQLMGRGAVLGGVGGFTKDEDLLDAAIGAGAGAVLGAAARGVDVARNKFVRSQLAKHYKDIRERADNKILDLVAKRVQFTSALEQAENAGKMAITPAGKQQAAAQAKQIKEMLGVVNKAIGGARGNITNAKSRAQILTDDVEMLKRASGGLLRPGPLLSGALKDTMRQGLAGGAVGGAIGGGSAYAAGLGPEAIVMSALGGAGLGAVTMKAKAGAAAKIPAGTAETAARAGTMAFTSQQPKPQVIDAMPWEQESSEEMPEAAPTQSAASGKAPAKSPTKDVMPWEQ